MESEIAGQEPVTQLPEVSTAIPEAVTVEPAKKEKKVKAPATAKKEMTIKDIKAALVKKAKALKLNEEIKESRITFSNAHRVCAFEERKKFVLIHLPKKENLKDVIETANENGKEVDHIYGFTATYDKRTWGYIRVSRAEELEQAGKVIDYVKDHNA